MAKKKKREKKKKHTETEYKVGQVHQAGRYSLELPPVSRSRSFVFLKEVVFDDGT